MASTASTASVASVASVASSEEAWEPASLGEVSAGVGSSAASPALCRRASI